MPATINPAGRNIIAEPTLVNSINETMNKLANVGRLNKDLILGDKLLTLGGVFDISPTVAHFVLNCIERRIKYDNKLESGTRVPSTEDASVLPRGTVNKSESFSAHQFY
jgi:hypothetical protein